MSDHPSVRYPSQTPDPIQRDVLPDRRQSSENDLDRTLKNLHDELLKLPTLKCLIDQQLESALGKRFAPVSLTAISVVSHEHPVSDRHMAVLPLQQVSTRSLSETLLEHYNRGAWPRGQSREFTAPGYVSSVADIVDWENALANLSGQLDNHLERALHAFWEAPLDNGLPRRDLFIDAMGTGLRAERRQQEQERSDTTDIALTPGSPSVFKEQFKNILAKQLDNVKSVLARYRASNGALALAAAFDSALDVRALIDSRLVSLAPLGRWSQRLDPSPSEIFVEPGLRRTLAPTLETVRYQLRTLSELKTTLAAGLQKRPHLKAFIQSELATELNLAHGGNLSPDNLYINHYASALPSLGDTTQVPNRSQSLVEHFLQRLTQHTGAQAKAPNIGLFSKDADGNWSRDSNLDIAQLNTLVDKALADFLGRYLRQQRSLYSELSEPLSEAVSSGLRREAQLKVLWGALNETHLEVLDNILDSLHRDQRPGLRGFIPDAFALTLRTDAWATPVKLHNCFLLTERGGLNTEHSGTALLWTPVQGAETFHSFHAAEVELQRRLHDPVERLSLLENIARNERPAKLPSPQNHLLHHPAYPALDFELIQNGFRGTQQHSLVDKAMGDLTHAAASSYSGEHFHQHLQSCLEAHSTLPTLEKAIQSAENAALHLALPPWLASTTDSRQFALAALLDRYRQDAAQTDDFHQDIPDIRDNARAKVTGLLSRDFPAARIDPDKVTVSLTLRNAASAIKESLTDFALRHFDDIDQSSIVVRTLEGLLPRELTPERLKTLVKEATVGSHYGQILDSYLSAGELAQRRPAFGKHFFWQTLLHAFTQVIRNTLSGTAHSYIKHLLAMPDGLARKPLDGQPIHLRPLELISDAQAKADPVAGFYLIGPSPGERGPQILFTPQGPQPIFREYTDEAALLADLKDSDSLQQRVLDRLAHGRREHYARQVFSAQRAALAISDNPLRGNLFHRLYQDTTALLKDLLGRQSVQGQHPAWSNVLSWLKGGLQQGAMFMLGRLRLPLLIWQTLPQLKDAAQKAWQGRWGDAIEEFVIALGQLAVARRGWSRSSLTGLAQTETEAPIESPFPEPAWGDSRLTPGQRAVLLGHEAHEVALQDMTLNLAAGLYQDPTTGNTFAAVGGKVFQVQESHRRWRIVKDNARGPRLQQNRHKQWSFDLQGDCIEDLSQ